MTQAVNINNTNSSTNGNYISIEDWKELVRKFTMSELVYYLNKKFGFPIDSKLGKKDLILEVLNKPDETFKDIISVIEFTDKVDKDLFKVYATSKGIPTPIGVTIKVLAIDLYFTNPEFLKEAYSVSNIEHKKTFYEVRGKEPKNIRVDEQLRKRLEDEFEEETLKNNQRLNVLGLVRVGSTVKISIFLENKEKRYLRFNQEKEIVFDFYKPVNKISAKYNTESNLLQYNPGRFKSFSSTFKTKLGSVLFDDPEFFPESDEIISDTSKIFLNPIPRTNELHPDIPNYELKEIKISELNVKFNTRTNPVFHIKSDDILETIQLYYKNLDFKEGTIISFTIKATFEDNNNHPLERSCLVESGKAIKVDPKFKIFFNDLLSIWEIRNEF